MTNMAYTAQCNMQLRNVRSRFCKLPDIHIVLSHSVDVHVCTWGLLVTCYLDRASVDAISVFVHVF